MPLILELGDALDAHTEAILLTVDGLARNKKDSARPIRGGKEILGGNIANQFAKRWPEDWEDMQLDIPFPVPIGRSVGIPWDGDCPWRLIVLASTLHHVGERTDAEKLAIIWSALIEALALTVSHDAKSLTTAALTGGWRLPLADAVNIMFAAYRHAGSAAQQVKLVLRTTSQDELELFRHIVKRHGMVP